MDKKEEVIKEIVYIFRTIVISSVAVFMCTKFFLKPIVVDGPSMYPTLHDKDFGFSFVLGSLLQQYNRFDVVIVHYEDRNLVKRIVGLPGETISYYDDVLYVNDEPIEETFFDSNWVKKNTFGGKTLYTEDVDEVTLGKDEYFVIGDNRPNSVDSRILGPIKANQIRSKYAFIVYPLESFGFVFSGK